MRKIQQNRREREILLKNSLSWVFGLSSLLHSMCVDNDGVDDDEEGVGGEHDVESHAVHLLGPTDEPIHWHLGIVVAFVPDAFLLSDGLS